MESQSISIVPVRTEQQAVDAVKLLSNIISRLRKDVLVKDMDFGIIPGTGDKPTLLLPGMEKLMRALNAVPEYIERHAIRDYDRPLFHYEYECRLIDADTGLAIPGGRGLGLCTSHESAFRWRKAERVCPTCSKSTIIKGKKEYGGGWVCFDKKGGCGAKFKDGDKSIEDQSAGRVENPDVYDQINAIMKRAKKRALGDAIKGAANVSEFFTVDLEDLVHYGDVVDVVPEELLPPKPPPPPHDPNKWENGNVTAWVDKHKAAGITEVQLRGILGIKTRWGEWQNDIAAADKAVEAWRNVQSAFGSTVSHQPSAQPTTND